MTVIVGLINEGRVHIGGDSAGISGCRLTVRKDPKVFLNGPYVMGFCGSFRMGQLLHHAFKAPKPKGNDLDGFMTTRFVDKLLQKSAGTPGWTAAPLVLARAEAADHPDDAAQRALDVLDRVPPARLRSTARRHRQVAVVGMPAPFAGPSPVVGDGFLQEDGEIAVPDPGDDLVDASGQTGARGSTAQTPAEPLRPPCIYNSSRPATTRRKPADPVPVAVIPGRPARSRASPPAPGRAAVPST